MVYCSPFPMKKRKKEKKSELNTQSFTCILFSFNKVFYRFEFIKKKKKLYIYIYVCVCGSLPIKNEKLKKKKKDLKFEKKKFIIKLLQAGQ